MKLLVTGNRFMAAGAQWIGLCRLFSSLVPRDVSASRGFLQPLPPAVELETVAATIANQGILIDTLALQQAKASYKIENIVPTQSSPPKMSCSSWACSRTVWNREHPERSLADQNRIAGHPDSLPQPPYKPAQS